MAISDSAADTRVAPQVGRACPQRPPPRVDAPSPRVPLARVDVRVSDTHMCPAGASCSVPELKLVRLRLAVAAEHSRSPRGALPSRMSQGDGAWRSGLNERRGTGPGLIGRSMPMNAQRDSVTEPAPSETERSPWGRESAGGVECKKLTATSSLPSETRRRRQRPARSATGPAPRRSGYP